MSCIRDIGLGRPPTDASYEHVKVNSRITSTNITACNVTASTVISDNLLTNQLTLPEGGEDGYVLTSDAGGNATWQPLPVTPPLVPYDPVAAGEISWTVNPVIPPEFIDLTPPSFVRYGNLITMNGVWQRPNPSVPWASTGAGAQKLLGNINFLTVTPYNVQSTGSIYSYFPMAAGFSTASIELDPLNVPNNVRVRNTGLVINSDGGISGTISFYVQ